MCHHTEGRYAEWLDEHEVEEELEPEPEPDEPEPDEPEPTRIVEPPEADD